MTAPTGPAEPRTRLWPGFLCGCVFVVLTAALFHLAVPPVYDFPEALPFSGDRWYNPYAGAGNPWYKANLHTHSRAWGGTGRAKIPTQQMYDRYKSLGYDVIGISNYQTIRPPMEGESLYVTTYEHGFGLGQQHQTVVGAEAVNWLDFPLFQGTRQKQCVVDHLRSGAELVILNHPNKADSYGLDGMRKLTGYTGVEVASKYARGAAHWDAALSAGRPVWGFCSDDRHHLRKLEKSGTGWIMVAAAERSVAAILRAARAGRFYGVWARDYRKPNTLERCELEDGRLLVRCVEPADSIRFIGRNGTLKKEAKGEAAAHYALQASDPYIRVEVETRATTLFLNPVYRHEGDPAAGPQATVAALPTALLRGLAALLFAAAVCLLVWVFVGHRRRARTSASLPTEGS